MRGYVIAALLGGLLSLGQADTVKTKDGGSYRGTARYSGADTIKPEPADTNEVTVISVSDVEEAKVDSPAARPAPPESLPPRRRFPPEYWEQQGYTDGSANTGMKSALAGVGGCLGVPAGALLGNTVGSAVDPSGSCLLVGAAAGGMVGCLGGSAVGASAQREAMSPAADSAGREAYRRGYQRGVRYSNNVSLGVGAGAAVVSAAGCVVLLVYLIVAALSGY